MYIRGFITICKLGSGFTCWTQWNSIQGAPNYVEEKINLLLEHKQTYSDWWWKLKLYQRCISFKLTRVKKKWDCKRETNINDKTPVSFSQINQRWASTFF